MCYAFTIAMQSETAALANEAGRAVIDAEQAKMPITSDSERSQSRKRSASTTLEHGPAKVAKSWDGDGRSREGSVATVATVNDGTEYGEDSGVVPKKEVQQLKDKANKIIKDLRVAKRESDEKLIETEGELAQTQVDYKCLRKSRGSGTSKEVISQMTENLNKKNEKKMSDVKSKCQKALDGMKERVVDVEQEAKDAKAEYTQKEKERQKEILELKKELRVEQAAEIKKFKADNSAEVKEKKDLVKMYEKKLHAYDKQNEASGEEIGTLQHKIARADAFKERAGKEIRSLRDAVKKKDDFALSIGQEYAAKTASLEAKLVHEGKRWAKQKECCEELEQKLVTQQRINFVLRNNNDAKAEKLGKMIVEMARLRGLPGVSTGAEAGGQGRHEDIEVVVDEKTKTVIEAMGKETDQAVVGAKTAKDNDDAISAAPTLAKAENATSPANGAEHDVSAPFEKADTPVAEGAFDFEKSTPSEGAKTLTLVGKSATDVTAPHEKMDTLMEQSITPITDEAQIPNLTVADSEMMDINEEAKLAKQSLDLTADSVEKHGLDESITADQGEQQQRGWNHARVEGEIE